MRRILYINALRLDGDSNDVPAAVYMLAFPLEWPKAVKSFFKKIFSGRFGRLRFAAPACAIQNPADRAPQIFSKNTVYKSPAGATGHGNKPGIAGRENRKVSA